MRLSTMVPRALVDDLKMRRARKAHRDALYIRSPLVATEAVIGASVGIAEGVLVNPGVEIGDHTYVNRGALIFSGKIGKFCSIAHYAQIGAEQHPVRHLSTSPRTYSFSNVFGVSVHPDENPEPPDIGNDVWIGSAAIVQQGVRIGDGAIVAAGAVVTRDVAAYQIVAGVPARSIGTRFHPDVVAMILADPWWDAAPEDVPRLRRCFEAGENWPKYYER